MNAEENSTHLLFDSFCILSIESGNRVDSYVTKRLDEFFYNNLHSLPAELEEYVFPDANLIAINGFTSTETSSFIIVGTKNSGLCKRISFQSPIGENTMTVLSLCIFTQQNSQVYSVLWDILRLIESLFTSISINDIKSKSAKWTEKVNMINDFLKEIVRNQVVATGIINVTSPQTNLLQSDFTTITFVRQNYINILIPNYYYFKYPRINPLPMVKKLNSNKMIKLFSALLLEKKIIFTSSNVELLTNTIQLAISTTYPLLWQALVIPILPSTQLNYIHSPCPYVIGIHSSLFNEKIRKTEGTIVIDLDTKRVTTNYNYELELLLIPERCITKLRQDIDDFKVGTKNVKVLNHDSFWRIFREFFLSIISEYIDYIEATPEGKYKFNKERFFSDQPKDLKKLFETLSNTLLFRNWIFELELSRERCAYDGSLFEKESIEWNALHPRKIVGQLSQGISSVVSSFFQSNTEQTPKSMIKGFVNSAKSFMRDNSVPKLEALPVDIINLPTKPVNNQLTYADSSSVPKSADSTSTSLNQSSPHVENESISSLNKVLKFINIDPPAHIHPDNEKFNQNPFEVSFSSLHTSFNPTVENEEEGQFYHTPTPYPPIPKRPFQTTPPIAENTSSTSSSSPQFSRSTKPQNTLSSSNSNLQPLVPNNNILFYSGGSGSSSNVTGAPPPQPFMFSTKQQTNHSPPISSQPISLSSSLNTAFAPKDTFFNTYVSRQNPSSSPSGGPNFSPLVTAPPTTTMSTSFVNNTSQVNSLTKSNSALFAPISQPFSVSQTSQTSSPTPYSTTKIQYFNNKHTDQK